MRCVQRAIFTLMLLSMVGRIPLPNITPLPVCGTQAMGRRSLSAHLIRPLLRNEGAALIIRKLTTAPLTDWVDGYRRLTLRVGEGGFNAGVVSTKRSHIKPSPFAVVKRSPPRHISLPSPCLVRRESPRYAPLFAQTPCCSSHARGASSSNVVVYGSF